MVVTGASAGIGRAVAAELARLGADLILVGRSPERHRAVLGDLERIGSGHRLIKADLASLSDVAGAAAAIDRIPHRPSVLVNNAGMGGRRGVTFDGFELAFGVNYLSHYLLTMLLGPALASGGDGVVVNLSSNAHFSVQQFEPKWAIGRTASLTGIREYAHSKAAMAAFALDLAGARAVPGISAIAVHPGTVATDIWRTVPRPFRRIVVRSMISPEEASATVMRAVVDRALASGTYLTPEGPRPPGRMPSDPRQRQRLWDMSTEWVAPFR